MTLWEALHKYPPYYVRLLAKQGHASALSDADIAIVSGIDLNRVRQIKELKSWDSMTVGEIKRYTMGCNFDPTKYADRCRVVKYDYQWKTRQTTPFHFQRKAAFWESEILPVLMILRAELNKKSLAA